MNKEELLYQIATLEQENKQLKEQWDKAIEYIEEHKGKTCNSIMEDWKEEYVLLHKNTVELLEILKGDNNE